MELIDLCRSGGDVEVERCVKAAQTHRRWRNSDGGMMEANDVAVFCCLLDGRDQLI